MPEPNIPAKTVARDSILTAFREKVVRSKLFWAILALVAILAVAYILRRDFFNVKIQPETGMLYGSLIDILNRVAEILIIAMGMTLVIATGGTDLSVGAIVAMSGAIAVSLIRGESTLGDNSSAMPFWIVIVVPLIIATLCGAWNGFLISRLSLQPIIATLILMVAGRGIAQIITGARLLTTGYEPFLKLGRGQFLAIPTPVYLWLLVFAIALLLTRRTALGMFIQSVGINASASRLSGLSAKNVKLLAYMISGLCAGLAGIIYASRIGVADANNAGLNYELDAILAVVIGGTSMSGGRFSLGGTVVGALIIRSVITIVYYFNITAEATMVFKALIVVLVILLQSEPMREFFAKRHSIPRAVKGGA